MICVCWSAFESNTSDLHVVASFVCSSEIRINGYTLKFNLPCSFFQASYRLHPCRVLSGSYSKCRYFHGNEYSPSKILESYLIWSNEMELVSLTMVSQPGWTDEGSKDGNRRRKENNFQCSCPVWTCAGLNLDYKKAAKAYSTFARTKAKLWSTSQTQGCVWDMIADLGFMVAWYGC